MSTDTLVFVANRAQLLRLQTEGNASSWTVVSSHFDVLAELESRGVACIDLWDYVEATELMGFAARAWKLCFQIGAALRGCVQYSGIDLSERCCADLFWPLNAMYCITAAVRAVLAAAGPSMVVHFAEMSEVDFRNLPAPPPDIFNACVAKCAAEAGLRVQALSLGSALPGPSLFKPRSEKIRDCRQIEKLPARVDVVSFCEQLGCDEQEYLLNLAGSERNWLAASSDEPRSVRPYLSLKYLRWLPFGTEEATEQLIPFETVWRTAIRDLGQEESKMLSGEWFSFLWRGFAALLIEGIRECALGRFVAGALAQRVAVIGYDLGGAARCLVEGLRSRGGDVVAVDHVGICTSLEGMLNEGARAHIAVWGEFDRELQARHRGPGCRVEVIGSMRRDFAVSGGADTTGGVARRPKMVIITSVTSIDERMYGWAKPGGVRRTWQRLMPWLSAHPEWDVVIKAHPRYDHYDFYEKLIAGRGPGSTVSLARAEEVLRGADVAVLMNVPSTAVVHALQAGVPVIYLCDNVFHDYRTPLEQGGAVCCSTTAEFEVEVERILTDASYRAAICGRQKKFLNRALAATGEESARRMMEFVESVASRTDGRGAESPPARWIIDLLAALNYLMMGAVDEHGFQRELAALKERGALLSFAAVENLRVDLIGAYFLRVATWGEWTCENPPLRPRVLWMVFRALPRSLRPSWSDLRAHLVHSLDEESGAGRGSVVRRLMCRLAVILLAPGRLIDRGRKA